MNNVQHVKLKHYTTIKIDFFSTIVVRMKLFVVIGRGFSPFLNDVIPTRAKRVENIAGDHKYKYVSIYKYEPLQL